MLVSRLGAGIVAAVALGVAAAAATGGKTVALPEDGGPVVLELFTSQGCSSCPPADRVLSRLGLDAATRDRVVPLAFHVDYWNRLGWRDPFSAAEWSARQFAYQRVLDDGAYTPQLVIDGRTHVNGARAGDVLTRLAEALRRASATRLSLESREAGAGRLAVEAALEVTAEVDARRLDVLVALFENGIVTEVGAGENAHRTLTDDFVVRRLDRAFRLDPVVGAGGHGSVSFSLDSSWNPGRLGVAAFAQDPRSMRIYGAAVLKPKAP